MFPAARHVFSNHQRVETPHQSSRFLRPQDGVNHGKPLQSLSGSGMKFEPHLCSPLFFRTFFILAPWYLAIWESFKPICKVSRTFKSTKPAAVLCATGWLEPIRSTVWFVCNGLQSDRDLEHKKLSATLQQTKHSKPSKQTGQKQWKTIRNEPKPEHQHQQTNKSWPQQQMQQHPQTRKNSSSRASWVPFENAAKKHQIKMIALIRGGHWQLTFQHGRAGMKQRIVIFSRLTIYIYMVLPCTFRNSQSFILFVATDWTSQSYMSNLPCANHKHSQNMSKWYQ